MGVFLRWWLITTLVIVTSVFSKYFGLFNEIWIKDASFLSFATLGLFYFMTACCGMTTWNVCRFKKEVHKGIASHLRKEQLEEFARSEKMGWFASEQCLAMGMLGTIIGFVMMLSGFESLNLAETHTIQQLLSQLGKSMATALYTTLVGLVCGCLLKLQYFNLGLELEKLHEGQ